MILFRKKTVKAAIPTPENIYIGPENFTDEEIRKSWHWQHGFLSHYNFRNITVNHMSFDLAHYYRVKQSRGLINAK